MGSNGKAGGRKRVVIMSDTHCGHLMGLTPPDWQVPQGKRISRRRDKAAALERESWRWYADKIKELKPIDVVIFNADAIDGRGERSGGTELLTSDRDEQVTMALACLAETGARRFVLTYGTAYHTGDAEDFEDNLVVALRASEGVESVKIGSHEWVDVNGLTFDVKHFIGSSAIPHGRYTSLARDVLWNELWAEHDEQPRADVIIRSHVHYFVYCGDDTFLAIITPALQTMGTKFGSRKCSGRVHFGLVHFDVDERGGYTWQAHVAKLEQQKARIVHL